MTVSSRWMIALWSVTVLIGLKLTMDLFAILPLYASGEIRGQAKQIMLSLRNDKGIPTSFFNLYSLECTDGSCSMLLDEQWNTITSHSPRERMTVAWNQASPKEYTVSYGTK